MMMQMPAGKMRCLFVIFVPCLALTAVSASSDRKPKIAVIGAGIGGSSGAHFLRELFGDDTPIDIYESKDIGGRLNTVKIGAKEYEAGASIIHPRNEYMVNLTKLLGLRPKDQPKGRLSLFDGDQFVLDGSSWPPIFLAQLLWRYGYDMVRMHYLVSDFFDKFQRIYRFQDLGMSFTTVEGLLASMSPDFPEQLLTRSMRRDLREKGFSDHYIEELVRGGLLVNYAQDVDMQAFAGTMSVACIQPGLWAVHGGNKQLAQQLIQRSKVKVIQAEVIKVTLKQMNSLHSFELKTARGSTTTYDVVIVATPLNEGTSKIDFVNFPKPLGKFSKRFKRVTANFVEGQINLDKFGSSSEADFPKTLLMTDPKLFYKNIGKHFPVDFHWKDYRNVTHVWKVLSEKPLTDAQLSELFTSRTKVKHLKYLAFPQYGSAEESTSIPSFQLHPQLYYINGIEWAASALEMSAIGARNVALLAHNNWYGRRENINRVARKPEAEKTEL